MGRHCIDLTNRRFGRLLVIGRTDKPKKGRYLWVCKCDCGNITEVQGSSLLQNLTKSCGCLRKEVCKTTHTKHGEHGTRLYTIWQDMLLRCNYPKAAGYKNYGGRGISVCQEWSKDYISFRDWALVNGYKENLTIDRINNDGNYEPSNCRWATYKEQNNNSRNCKTYRRYKTYG